MSAPDVSDALYGRDGERAVLSRLLEGARAGQSGVLVLRGEAGVGKTVLMQHLLRSASGFRIARASGVESEMELAYAGLHQLCNQGIDRVQHLPEPQRDALEKAFGTRLGAAPDRFLVSLASLNLLSEMADDRPLICVIDDAQWLDRASMQAMIFVARRLHAESIVMIFSVRTSPDETEPGGEAFVELPGLTIDGLRPPDAQALLDSVLTSPVDVRVRERIVAETRGNPLALLELTRERSPAELAFGFGIRDSRRIANRIERGFRDRLELLAFDTRVLLLLAAAEPLGDVSLLWRAARLLGVGAESAAAAQSAGLIEITESVRFRHPLVRSAVYGAAPVDERHRIHRVLAEATDADLQPDRRAWHRAQASVLPDEGVAAALEQSADRARTRGGSVATAAFLMRAAELTPEGGRRASRFLAAAEASLQAGEFDRALALLAAAEDGMSERAELARAALLHAQIAFLNRRGGTAARELMVAAQRLEEADLGLARATYLDAYSAAMFAGRLNSSSIMTEIAKAVRGAPTGPAVLAHGHRELLLEALSVRSIDGFAASVPVARQAVEVFRTADLPAVDALRWLWLASAVAADLWDDLAWSELVQRHMRIAREAGALVELPLALNTQVIIHVFCGELQEAGPLVERAQVVNEATGAKVTPYGELALSALQGPSERARHAVAETVNEVMKRGEGIGLTVAHWATAIRAVSTGRYEEALAAARLATEDAVEFSVPKWALPDLVEAAVRVGELDEAARALECLSSMATASGTDWALGITSRARALVADDQSAEQYHLDAIDRLDKTILRLESARARLLYGEWLRRQNRRVEARAALNEAHATFNDMGADGFAERARRELVASGATARKRVAGTRSSLTAQESQIARMAVIGQTNAEIGGQLFISARTVEWHLGKVFVKLGVTSRRQLAEALRLGGPGTAAG